MAVFSVAFRVHQSTSRRKRVSSSSRSPGFPRKSNRMESLDFPLVFRQLPACLLLLDATDPGFRILEATDAYLRATMTERESIVAMPMFEAFPDNPADAEANGVKNLSESFERVMRNLAADRMPLQRYDIRRPDGRFEERFWMPANTPVFSPDGELRYIVHQIEDARPERNSVVEDRLAPMIQRVRESAAELKRAAEEISVASDYSIVKHSNATEGVQEIVDKTQALAHAIRLSLDRLCGLNGLARKD